MTRPRTLMILFMAALLAVPASSAAAHPEGEFGAPPRKGQPRIPERLRAPFPEVLNDFVVLGHESFGKVDSNGDVWFHDATAYVGTWRDPCTGQGAKVVDVSDPADPVVLGRVGARAGTSAEDVVVRSVDTPTFTGDLLAVGIQRCGGSASLDDQPFGVQFWDVTDPTAREKLSVLNVRRAFGGVHELDLFQRGAKAYALLASPYREWDGPNRGDVVIVDVTDPAHPDIVGQWGARSERLTRGPFDGRGSFGSSFAHSVRASADGMRAFVSYWDLGVVVLDISDPTDPARIRRTRFDTFADGDAHSVTEHVAAGTDLIFQNDEDFDPRSPVRVVIGRGPAFGVGSEAPYARALWSMPEHRAGGLVYRPLRQGCALADYPNPSRVVGRIVVVRTYMTFFDPEPHRHRACTQVRQERLARRLGAKAVLHDVIAKRMSPQWWDSSDRLGIPVVLTRHRVALRILERGRTRLQATRPSWGYLRVFDAQTGHQVARFDDVPRMHTLRAGGGTWSIHNTEILGDRAYSSWYTAGVVALDLGPLDDPGHSNPTRVGRFVPNVGQNTTGAFPDGLPQVWGVDVDPVTGYLYVSDMTSGLWIVEPTGDADPT
ncbi:MAG TPA: hypothetical protein VFZ75_12675 [Actinomycetota bacterium]|nr:hypothetical protein [Actinomycetota bacterium]